MLKIIVRVFTVPTLSALCISFGIQSVPVALQFLDLSMTASTSSVVISSFVFATIGHCNWFSSSSFHSLEMLSRSVQCSVHLVLISPGLSVRHLFPLPL